MEPDTVGSYYIVHTIAEGRKLVEWLTDLVKCLFTRNVHDLLKMCKSVFYLIWQKKNHGKMGAHRKLV